MKFITKFLSEWNKISNNGARPRLVLLGPIWYRDEMTYAALMDFWRLINTRESVYTYLRIIIVIHLFLFFRSHVYFIYIFTHNTITFLMSLIGQRTLFRYRTPNEICVFRSSACRLERTQRALATRTGEKNY